MKPSLLEILSDSGNWFVPSEPSEPWESRHNLHAQNAVNVHSVVEMFSELFRDFGDTPEGFEKLVEKYVKPFLKANCDLSSTTVRENIIAWFLRQFGVELTLASLNQPIYHTKDAIVRELANHGLDIEYWREMYKHGGENFATGAFSTVVAEKPRLLCRKNRASYYDEVIRLYGEQPLSNKDVCKKQKVRRMLTDLLYYSNPTFNQIQSLIGKEYLGVRKPPENATLNVPPMQKNLDYVRFLCKRNIHFGWGKPTHPDFYDISHLKNLANIVLDSPNHTRDWVSLKTGFGSFLTLAIQNMIRYHNGVMGVEDREEIEKLVIRIYQDSPQAVKSLIKDQPEYTQTIASFLKL